MGKNFTNDVQSVKSSLIVFSLLCTTKGRAKSTHTCTESEAL